MSKNYGKEDYARRVCPCAGALSQLKVWDDPKVVYTFHIYAPNEFTHQRGVLQQPQCFYNRDMPYPGDIERYRHFMKTVWGKENAYAQNVQSFVVLDDLFRSARI